jgi:hypothetical protein
LCLRWWGFSAQRRWQLVRLLNTHAACVSLTALGRNRQFNQFLDLLEIVVRRSLLLNGLHHLDLS